MLKVNLNREAFEIAITRRNLSQKGLAERLHISRSYLSEIVTGKRAASPYMRQRLLDYFRDCTFDDLFAIKENGIDNGKPNERA
jgi:transcriptional regulator with XRE-family HTH domain